jgi:hypothetical protein
MTANDPIGAALHRAQRSAHVVAKDATNAHHRYQYVSSETMLAHARHALLDAGLVLAVDDWSVVPGDPPMLHVQHVLSHPESGASRMGTTAWPIIEGKGRPLDKAVAGALTTGLSYMLRGLLLIPRGDETEIDKRDDRHHAPEQNPPPRKESSGRAARPDNGANAADADEDADARYRLLLYAVRRKAGCTEPAAQIVLTRLIRDAGFQRSDLAHKDAYDDLVTTCRKMSPKQWSDAVAEAHENHDPDGRDVPTFAGPHAPQPDPYE